MRWQWSCTITVSKQLHDRRMMKDKINKIRRPVIMTLVLCVSVLLITTSCGKSQGDNEAENASATGNTSSQTGILTQESQGAQSPFVLGPTYGKASQSYVAETVPNEEEDSPSDEFAYSDMPDAGYGKSRNWGVAADEAGEVNYTNFLGLEIGLSVPEVRAMFPGAEPTPDESEETVTMESFTLDGYTTIRVEYTDGKLEAARFDDYLRLFTDEADIGMDHFLRLKIGMSLVEAKTVLGGTYHQNLMSGATSAYIWFNEWGYIEVTTDMSDTVVSLKQEGFSYLPDGRGEYLPLTAREVVDRYSGVELRMNYARLEEQMGSFIPLCMTWVRTDHKGEIYVMDYYCYRRMDPMIHLNFVFIDGELVQVETGRVEESLMPMTDVESARKIRQGMSYDEVEDILGVDGFKTYWEENEYLDGGLYEKYYWKLPGDAFISYMEVQFLNGTIDYDSGIKIHGAIRGDRS